MSETVPHTRSIDPGHDPRGPFQPTPLPEWRLRWWIPTLVVAVLVAGTIAVVFGQTVYRTALSTCIGTSNTFQPPAGWTRVNDTTFRHGDVEGTILRIGVAPPFDPIAVIRRRDLDFTTRYDTIIAGQARAVGAKPFHSGPATPLQGAVGSIWGFTYDTKEGRKVRIDHVMHPPEGGCGWLFRAEFDQDGPESQQAFAENFPRPLRLPRLRLNGMPPGAESDSFGPWPHPHPIFGSMYARTSRFALHHGGAGRS